MDNTSLVLNQMISGAFTAYVVEWLKKFRWFPIISDNSLGNAKRVFSFVVAVATSVGLSYHFEEATRNLVIHIPTFWEAAHTLFDIGKVFMFQQMTYKAVIKEDRV